MQINFDHNHCHFHYFYFHHNYQVQSVLSHFFWECFLHFLPFPFCHTNDDVSTNGVGSFLSTVGCFFLPEQLLCIHCFFYIIHCWHPWSVMHFHADYISIWININLNIFHCKCCLCSFASNTMFHPTSHLNFGDSHNIGTTWCRQKGDDFWGSFAVNVSRYSLSANNLHSFWYTTANLFFDWTITAILNVTEGEMIESIHDGLLQPNFVNAVSRRDDLHH